MKLIEIFILIFMSIPTILTILIFISFIIKEIKYKKIKKKYPKVFELIKNNDSYAEKRFQEFCRNVALLIHNMQTVLDVDRYVIGGGISRQKIVVEGINKAFDKLRAESDFVNNTLMKPQIVSSKLYNAANLYGAISRFEMGTEHTNELKSVGNM